MWRLLNDDEQQAIRAALELEQIAAQRLRVTLGEVEKQRSLARKLAMQSKKLLEELAKERALREEAEAAALTPPPGERRQQQQQQQQRLHQMIDDLQATVEFADRRDERGGSDDEAVLAYSPPS
jgi:hypothetical protein